MNLAFFNGVYNAMLKSGKKVQIILIFSIALAFVLLKFMLPENTSFLTMINLFFLICTTIIGVNKIISKIGGNEDDHINNQLLIRYRILLRKKWFLVFSNFILLIAFLGIFYQIFWFRNVDFFSSEEVELYSGNGNEPKIIGNVPGEKIITFRIHVGDNNFLFKRPLDDNYTSLPPKRIPFFLFRIGSEPIRLIPTAHYSPLL